MALSARTSLVLDAIRLALATIETLPVCTQTVALRERCEACEHVAKRWEHVPPTTEEREVLMQTVLSLHASVAKVRRSSRPPPGSGREG